jgi:glycosyltransferase involved in cell wall biosynthesis
MKISIVIPVFNSQDCLFPLHEAVLNAFKNFDSYELIFVNDKSRDKSWEMVTELCAINPHVKGISLRRNFGQDNAILAGMRLAKGEYVVVMDDDLQHDPADILKLYEECSKGFDACYARFSEKKQKVWKNIGSWLNGKFSEKLLDKPRELYLSPFKIIKKEVVDELIQFKSSYSYIDATLLTLTSNISQIAVPHHARIHGKGNYNFLKSLLVFVNHMTSYSVYPLRMLTVAGFTTAMLSFIIAGVYIIQYLYSDKRVEGWISIILLIIFFGGLILMSIGLIGEYIGRIFLSVNNKAQYSIEKVIQHPGGESRNNA